MQSVPITTNVVSLNPAHGEVLLIQHGVIKFVSDLRQVGVSPGTPDSSTNKTDQHLKQINFVHSKTFLYAVCFLYFVFYAV
jgi:hypothetical protein